MIENDGKARFSTETQIGNTMKKQEIAKMNDEIRKTVDFKVFFDFLNFEKSYSKLTLYVIRHQ